MFEALEAAVGDLELCPRGDELVAALAVADLHRCPSGISWLQSHARMTARSANHLAHSDGKNRHAPVAALSARPPGPSRERYRSTNTTT